MRDYGTHKATEFSKKQIGVIYYKSKSGELNIEKWFISELYNLSDFYGYDDNGNVENCEKDVLNILEAVFAGELEKAQKLINDTQDAWYKSYGRKMQSSINREAYVA